MNRKQQQAVQIALKKQGVLHHWNSYDPTFKGAVLVNDFDRFDLSNVNLKDVPKMASNIRDIEVRRINQNREQKQRDLTHTNRKIVAKESHKKLSNSALQSKINQLEKAHESRYTLTQKNPHNYFHKDQFNKVNKDLHHANIELSRRKDNGRYSQVKY